MVPMVTGSPATVSGAILKNCRTSLAKSNRRFSFKFSVKKDSELTKMEALARCKTIDFGLVSPGTRLKKRIKMASNFEVKFLGLRVEGGNGSI